MLRKNAACKTGRSYKYKIDGNLNMCEKHADSVVLRLKKEMQEIPKWLTTLKKRLEDVMQSGVDVSVVSESSVFEMTQAEYLFPPSNNKKSSFNKKQLSLIREDDDNVNHNSSANLDATSLNTSINEFMSKMTTSTNSNSQTLPKPTTSIVQVDIKKKSKVNPPSKVTTNKTAIKKMISPFKTKINKINEKSKRTFAQMSKSTTQPPISSSDNNAPSKVTSGENSFREKLAKCETMNHQKKVQMKSKQEEMKSKTMSRIMANKERRMRAEEERMQKYKYEELRKQVAREKIAELNKNSKPTKTHQLTPIKFKTHSVINPTAMYTGKDTSKLSNLPSRKKDQRSDFKTLETIPDISVSVANNECNATTQSNQDTITDATNNLLSVLDDGESLIKNEDHKMMFEDKMAGISSTPFNNGQNHKRSLNNIDATFNENPLYVAPLLNLVIEDALNFSTTLKPVETSNHTTEDANNNTFVLDKEESHKNSSTVIPQYEMTIVDSQTTSDEDEYLVQCSDSTKPIPDWARSEKIWNSITKQITEKKLIADSIFGPIPRVNMKEIFKNTNRDFDDRNNSSMFNDSIDIN